MDTLNQDRTHFNQLFPGPEEGRVVEINPPPFYWLKVEGATGYTVHLERVGEKAGGPASGSDGGTGSFKTRENYFIPSATLPPGDYRWDLEVKGRRRGWFRFHLSADAARGTLPTADEILSKVPPKGPRHYLRPGDVSAVRRAHSPMVPVLRRNIALALADGLPFPPDAQLMGETGLTALRAREWTNLSRRFVDRNLVACALGHMILEDGKAARHGRLLLLTVCNWNPEGPSGVDSPWGDEVGLSMARCLPFCIEALSGVLSEKELRFAKTALAAYARQTFDRLRRTDFTNTPGDSHVGRLGGYLGEAAVVLHGFLEGAEIKSWLEESLRIYATFFPFFGGADGGWAEGVFYGSSYTRWYLPFFLLVERLTGFAFLERPFYRRVAGFFLHFARRDWDIHPFGDGWWCHPEDAEWPGFMAQDPFRVYGDRFGSGVVKAYRKKAERPRVFHLHLLDLFVPPSLLRPTKRKVAGLENKDALFPDTGFASMQCDLSDESKNHALVVRASKYGNGSHQHADQGSFAIVSKGRGLITPTGSFGARWGTEHHVRWTRQTRAHNCLLIGGKGQNPGIAGAARFESLTRETHGKIPFSKLVCDLGRTYEGVARYFRTFYFFKPHLVVVVDELDLLTPQSVTFCLHTSQKPDFLGARGQVKNGTASLSFAVRAGGKDIEPEMLQRYPVPVNQGIPSSHWVKRPEMFHLNYELPSARRHSICSAFAIGGKLALAGGNRWRMGDGIAFEESTGVPGQDPPGTGTPAGWMLA